MGQKPTHATRTVRIVCISDTHNDVLSSKDVPDGDIFIHAGDMTDNGTFEELKNAYSWISALSHEVKVVIGGKFRCFILQGWMDCHLLTMALWQSYRKS
jgi:hypothetical protein